MMRDRETHGCHNSFRWDGPSRIAITSMRILEKVLLLEAALKYLKFQELIFVSTAHEVEIRVPLPLLCNPVCCISAFF